MLKHNREAAAIWSERRAAWLGDGLDFPVGPGALLNDVRDFNFELNRVVESEGDLVVAIRYQKPAILLPVRELAL